MISNQRRKEMNCWHSVPDQRGSVFIQNLHKLRGILSNPLVVVMKKVFTVKNFCLICSRQNIKHSPTACRDHGSNLWPPPPDLWLKGRADFQFVNLDFSRGQTLRRSESSGLSSHLLIWIWGDGFVEQRSGWMEKFSQLILEHLKILEPPTASGSSAWSLYNIQCTVQRI